MCISNPDMGNSKARWPRKQLIRLPEPTERSEDKKDGDPVVLEDGEHMMPAAVEEENDGNAENNIQNVVAAVVKVEHGDMAECWDRTVVKIEHMNGTECWDGTIVKIEPWNEAEAGAAVKQEEEEYTEQTEPRAVEREGSMVLTEPKEPAAKRPRMKRQLDKRKMLEKFIKENTDKADFQIDDQNMNTIQQQACKDLEKATQCITQALQMKRRCGSVRCKQVCNNLEKATERIIQAFQYESGRNRKLSDLIGQLQEKEAVRCLKAQLEANKQLKQKIDIQQKRLEETQNLLTQANQTNLDHLREKHKPLIGQSEREAETRRMLAEQLVENRQLKMKIKELQTHLQEKDNLQTQANQTVTFLRGELRELRLQPLHQSNGSQDSNGSSQIDQKNLKVRLRELPHVSVPQSKSKCSVVGCTDQHQVLYSLPVATERRAAWLDFIFLNQVPKKVGRCMVCASHFKDDCFANIGPYSLGLASKIRLNDWAIPTIRGDTRESSTGIPDPPDLTAERGLSGTLQVRSQDRSRGTTMLQVEPEVKEVKERSIMLQVDPEERSIMLQVEAEIEERPVTLQVGSEVEVEGENV